VDNGAPAVLRVAIDMPRPMLFDYLPPPGIAAGEVPLGARVRVPMGGRDCVGIVAEYGDRAAVRLDALKPIHALIDQHALLDEALLQLLRWTAGYYHHPLGEVIAAALPKALREGAAARPRVELWRLRTAAAPQAPATIESLRRAPQQRSLLALLAAEPNGLPARVSAHSVRTGAHRCARSWRGGWLNALR